MGRMIKLPAIKCCLNKDLLSLKQCQYFLFSEHFFSLKGNMKLNSEQVAHYYVCPCIAAHRLVHLYIYVHSYR